MVYMILMKQSTAKYLLGKFSSMYPCFLLSPQHTITLVSMEIYRSTVWILSQKVTVNLRMTNGILNETRRILYVTNSGT